MQSSIHYPEFKNSIHVLGKMCRQKHEYKNTGKSMRRIKSNECVICERMRARRYLKTDKGKIVKKRATNTPHAKAYQERYNQTDARKGKMKGYRAKYFASEKGRLSKRTSEFNRRQNIIKAASPPFTPSQLRRRYTLFGNVCAYCGSSEHITMDHVTPVAKGGLHTIDNIIPCCKKCNSGKRSSDLIKWYTRTPFFDADRLNYILYMCKLERNYSQKTLSDWS